ncbi:MAG: zf-TFIIB domain-containing protein [Zoogloeaceae bacterium]|jgi:Zn-finger nucleic acid-binding protein|nr:zf-TFIIB domain-containing protein [Zoogloeaceae bacterium]
MKKTAPLVCGCGNGSRRPAGFSRIELAAGLIAPQCDACHGVALKLDDYLDWRQQHFAELPAIEPAPFPGREVPSRARTCPACGVLMARYRTGDAQSFWLDFCPACRLVWLDDGEWQALQTHGLAPYLDTILSDAWQKGIQARRASHWQEELLRARFGEETLTEIRRIQTWLATQPAAKRRDIVQFLGQSDR